ncbi:MAG TPA: hypothetical protein VFX70_03770 [Mycobacteriales bacterium]|nr:hypothetical protein [Mycobacteriales bacterium]
MPERHMPQLCGERAHPTVRREGVRGQWKVEAVIDVGLFGNSERLNLIEPDTVAVIPEIAERLPDPGSALMDLLGWLPDDVRRATAEEVRRVRHPNGSIPDANLDGIRIRDYKEGPLMLLRWMTAGDSIIVGVWASFWLRGRDSRAVRATAQEVAHDQGIPAAATWTIVARPDGRLNIDSLAEQLSDSWEKYAGQITNKDVIKAFRKWQR